MSTKKIQIITPIVTSVNGKTGDVTIDTSGGSGTTQMKKLTFTGGATGEYDGSSDVSIEIPNGGSSVQPDWNQNDSSASDYIKNRPCYSEKSFEAITWDGVIGDKLNFATTDDVQTIYLVFVSEQVPSKQSLIGTKISISNGEAVIIKEEDIDDTTISGLIVLSDEYVFIAKEDNIVVNSDEGLTLPKKGVYFGKLVLTKGDVATYTSELAAPENVVKLDANYLPAATTSTLGAIKVGNGLSLTEDGTLSVTTATYYSGTSTPTNTLGVDGDLYLQTEG